MPSSAVQICNKALAQLGKLDALIGRMDEASKEARTCNLFYSSALEELLSLHAWQFATKRKVLSASTTPPPTIWGYSYIYPTDCLVAQAIDDGSRIAYEESKIKFAIETNDANERVIFTDQSPATLIYTWAVTDPAKFPVWFEEALVSAMAVKLAMPLTADPKIQEAALRLYSWKFQLAVSANRNERAEDIPEPESIRARA